MSRTRSEAYRQLGVDSAAVERLPRVTQHLNHLMRSLTERGLPDDPLYYLNACPDPDARLLVDVYYAQKPFVQRLLPLEAFCLAAGVNPHFILDSIVSAIARLNRLNAAVQLSAAHPGVVGKTVERAMDDGRRDGHVYVGMLHKAAGFLPSPKGSQTIVNVQQNASASASSQAAALAPPPEQTIRRLSDRLNAARGLPAAAPTPAALSDGETKVEEGRHLEGETILVSSAEDDDD